jgi:hypothetical protein
MLKMILSDSNNRPCGLDINKQRVELDYDHGLVLKTWKHKSIQSERILKGAESEIFGLSVEEKRFLCSDFQIEEISSASDATQELISITLLKKEQRIKVRVCFLKNIDETISIIIQLAVKWKDDVPKEVYLQLPFLSNFKLQKNKETRYFLPLNPTPKKDGSSIVQIHENFPMSLGIVTDENGSGFCVHLPVMSETWRPYLAFAQNRNLDLSRIATVEQLRGLNVLLRPGQVLTDMVELNFSAVENGWVEFFNSWREKARSRFILSFYDREDLQWYRDVLLQHFTFIYGREIFDYAINKVDLGRLLAAGADFGGYDSVLLWHQYPRLGVDQRKQWDFFRDFPGGMSGLRAVTDEAHRKGVKVFLPFKPWDIGSDESLDSAARDLADLIRDSDVDGIFLDTMNYIPKVFREQVDRIKPGVVFCTEAHPTRVQNIQIITGGWDQHWNRDAMPEVDLLRYVLPEHIAPITSRWRVGDKKDVLIKRAIFNGTGIVIWQDIFGAWLPFDGKQKSWIKKWKGILKENLATYYCSHPVPLYPTLQDHLFCNYFKEDNGSSVIYSLYNDSEKRISGDLVVHEEKNLNRAVESWRNIQINLETKGDQIIIQGSIEPKEVLIVKMIET